MLITFAKNTHVDEWLCLAREMEPIFGAPMADEKRFHDFIARRLQRKEAFVALDTAYRNTVMGAIAFSRSRNAITWLGVFSQYRRMTAGSKLLESAIRELDNTTNVTVITFRGEDDYAVVARAFYEKHGFAVTDASFEHGGQLRCLMTKVAIGSTQ